MIRRLLLALTVGLFAVAGAAAQDSSTEARLDPAASSLRDMRDGVEVVLALSRAVPWRVRTENGPPRLVLEFRDLEIRVPDPAVLGTSAHVLGLRAEMDGDWSRAILDLAGPYAVDQAGMATGAEGAFVTVRLSPASHVSFAPEASETEAQSPTVGRPKPSAQIQGGPFRVMLDPGHGGVDPGAVRDGVHEADITLAFARELRAALRQRGGVDVSLTREGDVFVSLAGRIEAARRADADVFLSLHADAVPEGIARGAQVWTLSDEASSSAGAQLAAQHNRADLLAGVDLTGQDDQVARVLMDIARTETQPRADALADALVTGLRAQEIRLHSRPRESAAFAVLKAPDIPSALVELGFMSSPGELEKLLDPSWRARAAEALAEALLTWAEEDAARAALRWQ